LLPEGEASITRQGIRFEERYYTCDLALKEQWFVRAKERGAEKVLVSYDPRNVSRIYLRLDGGARLETCHLINPSDAFQNRDWYEVADELELRKQLNEASQTRKQGSQSEFHAQTDLIIKTAKKKALEVQENQSDRARLTGIRENRKNEREGERLNTSWLLGAGEPFDQQGILATPAQTETPTNHAPQNGETDYVPPSQPIDKLRKLRAKRLKNEK
jgi:Mu transposase, C-terminal.